MPRLHLLYSISRLSSCQFRHRILLFLPLRSACRCANLGRCAPTDMSVQNPGPFSIAASFRPAGKQPAQKRPDDQNGQDVAFSHLASRRWSADYRQTCMFCSVGRILPSRVVAVPSGLRPPPATACSGQRECSDVNAAIPTSARTFSTHRYSPQQRSCASSPPGNPTASQRTSQNSGAQSCVPYEPSCLVCHL